MRGIQSCKVVAESLQSCQVAFSEVGIATLGCHMERRRSRPMLLLSHSQSESESESDSIRL